MIYNKPLFPILPSLSDIDSKLKQDGSVAILMRTKNRPILLARAIESVIQQDYKNWHLYLINDGGDADSVDKLVQLNNAELQNKITVIHNPVSLGMEAASNCGFRLATEEFLVVHDDDDSWHPSFLKETVYFLQQNIDSVAVITNCIVIHEEIQDGVVKRLNTIYEWIFWKDHLDINNLMHGNVAPPICVLIRMKAAKTIGEFNENLPVQGDWDYNLRLFRVGNIKTLNKKLAYYHFRPNANNIYGNSVISGADKHFKYQVEYRNALVREFLLHNPGSYGLLHAILIDNEQRKNELLEKIDQLTERFNHIDMKLHKIQESVFYLKRKSFPIKRLVKKLRDAMRKFRGK